jgi:hypothetical protein
MDELLIAIADTKRISAANLILNDAPPGILVSQRKRELRKKRQNAQG